MDKPFIIKGKSHVDNRGRLIFMNDFDMTIVKRMYYIEPSNTNIIRAWQGHKVERKWFHCINGSFTVKIIRIDDWQKPSSDLLVEEYVLSASTGDILYIPDGYANGFKAIAENSTLLVFSDTSLKESLTDDYRFDTDYWNCKW